MEDRQRCMRSSHGHRGKRRRIWIFGKEYHLVEMDVRSHKVGQDKERKN